MDAEQSVLGGPRVDDSFAARITRVVRAKLAFGDDPLDGAFALTAAALHPRCFGLAATLAQVEDGVVPRVPRTGPPAGCAVLASPMAVVPKFAESITQLHVEGSDGIEVFKDAIFELKDAEGTIALLSPVPFSHPIGVVGDEVSPDPGGGSAAAAALLAMLP